MLCEVGTLLGQYGDLTRHLREEEKYDATLLICALQTLLVNCNQLIEAMKEGDKVLWKTSIKNGNGELGISDRLVMKNTFPGILNSRTIYRASSQCGKSPDLL